MTRLLMYFGTILTILGFGVGIGYWCFFVFKILLLDEKVSIVVKVVTPVTTLVIILLLVGVALQQFRLKRDHEEHLKGVKY